MAPTVQQAHAPDFIKKDEAQILLGFFRASPSRIEKYQVGLSPDVSCMPDGLRKIAAPVRPGKMVMNQGLNMPSVIEDIQLDGCVIAAEQQLLAMAHK